jgi:hypothetical protein
MDLLPGGSSTKEIAVLFDGGDGIELQIIADGPIPLDLVEYRISG